MTQGLTIGDVTVPGRVLTAPMTGVTDLIAPENIYTGDERVGATLKRAYADATAWIEHNRPATGTDAR